MKNIFGIWGKNSKKAMQEEALLKEQERARKEQKRNAEKTITRYVMDLRKSRDVYAVNSKNFEESALEAAKIGRNEFADAMLKKSVEMDKARELCEFLELKARAIAVQVNSLNNFEKLSEVTNAFKTLSLNCTDPEKLATDMSDLNDAMDIAEQTFGELTKMVLGDDADKVHAELFNSTNNKYNDSDFNQRLAEKKKALEMQLVTSGAVAPSPASNSINVDQSDIAKIDTIAAMMDEEKNKN